MESISQYPSFCCSTLVCSYIYTIFYFNWFYILNSFYLYFYKFNYNTSIALFFMEKKNCSSILVVKHIIFTICQFIHLCCTLFLVYLCCKFFKQIWPWTWIDLCKFMSKKILNKKNTATYLKTKFQFKIKCPDI